MPFLVAIILVVGLTSFFIYLNRGKLKTIYKHYPFETFETALNEAEQDFKLLLSHYRGDLIKVDKFATELARKHSQYMHTTGMVSHKNDVYREKALRDSGAKYVTEIVTAGKTVEVLMEKFKSSPKHNKAMLNMDCNVCGIGLYYQPQVYYITVILFKI